MLTKPGRSWPLPGGQVGLARAAFLVLILISIGLLLLMVPINLLTARSNWKFEETYPVVASFVTPSAYANYRLALNYAVALVCVVVGVMVAWQKVDEPVAWLAGVVLVSLPTAFNLGGYSETWSYYSWPWRDLFRAAHDVAGFACFQAIVLFAFLFPNGRLPLRWMRWPVLGFVGAMSALGAGVVLRIANDYFANWVYFTWLLLFGSAMLLGLAGQLFRYRRLSTPLERQQTKWVVVGLAWLVAVPLVDIALQVAAPVRPWAAQQLLVTDHLQLLSLVLVPVTLAFSILRYRLWDIDRLIRRSLLYAVLTGALAGLYLVSVVVLQSMLRVVTSEAPPQVVTVASTLFIAAAAGPLRTRVQSVIDRRFNRRRYDAACTLEAFSTAMRGDSVADLEALNRQLVGVVQDTLEPEKVSLWLRS